MWTVLRLDTPATDSSRGYEPFIEKLKPPVFLGKVEDFTEFLSVWNELLAGLPKSVQVQHIKSNIPASDSKRIAGLKTMKEVWERIKNLMM